MDFFLPIPTQVFVSMITLAVMLAVILNIVPVCVYLERKISAYIQDRIGPNRVGFDFGLPVLQSLFRGFGFWGLGQAAADGIKFLLKEDYKPQGADKYLFTLAPIFALVPAVIGWAVIPWGGFIDVGQIALGSTVIVESGRALVAGADINIGFIYLVAIASLGVYGITLGGWASNNKYSFLGALRCSAGMISYEIPLGIALITLLLVAGTVRPSIIAEQQIYGVWYVFAMPLGALLFYICILAEANRAPFDNAEAEQELVGGYHTEYSAMRFAMFFLGEYAHMTTSSAFCVLLFFGGYHIPGVAWTMPEAVGIGPVLVKVSVFLSKVMLSICFMMLIRWTIPRIRYDQVMQLAWQALIPFSIIYAVATSVMVFLQWTAWWQLLAMNVVIGFLVIAMQPLLPKSNVNRRVPMAGSRFIPLPGEAVSTSPVSGEALDDDNPLAMREGEALVGAR